MIKLGDKDLFPYLGDHRPINIYHAENKLARWKWETQSGEEIACENTYNIQGEDLPGIFLEIEGISIQDGTPSPDNPIPIESLNDFDILSSVGKENLHIGGNELPRTTALNPSSPKTFLRKGTTYTLSFKEMVGLTKFRLYFALFKNGIQITEESTIATHLSINPSSVYFQQANGTYILAGDSSYMSYSIVLDDDYEIAWSFSHGDSTSTSKLLNPKIELQGETNWAPRPEDISFDIYYPEIYKTNINFPEPLRSVGDVKDRLFRDVDGLWKVERKTSEITFEGINNTGWTIIDNTAYSSEIIRFQYVLPSFAPSNDIVPDSISNKFPNIGSVTSRNKYEEIRFHGVHKELMLYINKSRLTDSTATSLNTWFKTNPTTVIYKLSEIKIETLSQELQTKLNSIPSYKNTNYIWINWAERRVAFKARTKVKDV